MVATEEMARTVSYLFLKKIVGKYGIQQQHKGLNSYFKEYLD